MANIFERLAFIAEWFQEEAHLKRSFLLNYFPYDNGVEMFDRRTNRTFLKRTRVASLNECNFYIDAKVNIFGRQMVLVAYGDEVTRRKLENRRERTFCLIKPQAICKLGEISKMLTNNGFSLHACAMFEMTMRQCSEFVENVMHGNGNEVDMCNILTSGPIVAIELTGNNALNRLLKLKAGPENAHKLNGNNESCAELNFGHDELTEALYCSQSAENVSKEIEFFFPSDRKDDKIQLATSFQNTTLCIIKPHAIREGRMGDILMEIMKNGFAIRALKMFNLDRENGEEFFEIYKGVVAEYLQMVTELASGPFLALGIASNISEQNTYYEFRQLCGPPNPEIGRQIRPKTIRAQFGTNKIQNAVHCTDLEEDCTLELEYFFKMLSQ